MRPQIRSRFHERWRQFSHRDLPAAWLQAASAIGSNTELAESPPNWKIDQRALNARQRLALQALPESRHVWGVHAIASARDQPEDHAIPRASRCCCSQADPYVIGSPRRTSVPIAG